MPRILIVDDERDSADSLAQLLAIMGHEAFAAYDGPTALRLAADFNPDLILLDLSMPGMDGYQVARNLRSSGVTAALAAVTGHGRPEDIDRCLHAGFNHHILKPAAPSDIMMIMQSLLRPSSNP